MSRGLTIGLLSLVIVLALMYYLVRDQVTPLAGSREASPIQNAVLVKCAANQRVLESAVASFRLAHQGEGPFALRDLVPRHLAALPECPDGGAYVYDREAGAVSCPNGHGIMP
jgi:hypothetical protein